MLDLMKHKTVRKKRILRSNNRKEVTPVFPKPPDITTRKPRTQA